MLKRALLVGILCVQSSLALAGGRLPYAQAHALNVAKSATLYALGPARSGAGESFHGYSITATRTLSGTAALQATHAVRRAVGRFNSWSSACFVPKHGLRIVLGGRVFDYVLSFACNRMEEYEDGRAAYGVGIAGSSLVLDELLRTARP